uniref:hypothetical protein n=1 Tax=Roseburia sp. TaxID=2049040 RepID=UPI003FEE0EA3
MELISFINETFWGTSGYVVLFAISIFFILFSRDMESRGRFMAIYSVLVFVCVICNPLLGLIATEKFMSDDAYAYLRIFYVLPLMSVIAYAITEFYTRSVKQEDGTKKKAFMAVILAVTVMIAGQLYGSSMYVKAENLYKISQDAIEISDIIENDCGGETARALVPRDENISYGIRQYTGNIIIPGYSDEITNRKTLETFEEQKDFTYIVAEKNETTEKLLERYGYVRTGETSGYAVYKKS